MPDNATEERIKILKAYGYGAEVHLTPSEKGMSGKIEEAYRIAEKFLIALFRQFENPANLPSDAKVLALAPAAVNVIYHLIYFPLKKYFIPRLRYSIELIVF